MGLAASRLLLFVRRDGFARRSIDRRDRGRGVRGRGASRDPRLARLLQPGQPAAGAAAGHRRRQPDRADPDLGGVRRLARGRLQAAAEQARSGPMRSSAWSACCVLFGAVWSIRAARSRRRSLIAPSRAAGLDHPAGRPLHRGEAAHDPVGDDRAARARRRLGAVHERAVPEAALLVLAATVGIFVSDALGLSRRSISRRRSASTSCTRSTSGSPGQGPAMLNEFEEYGKHYLRDLPPVVPYDAWTPIGPRSETPACRSTPAATTST